MLCAASRPYATSATGRVTLLVDKAATAPTHLVTSHIPVLDPSLELVRVLGVVRDIANGVDVVLALDAEILVYDDTAVLLQLEARVLEELRGGSDTRTHDDEVGWERVLTLDLHRSDMGRVGFCERVQHSHVLESSPAGTEESSDVPAGTSFSILAFM